MSNPVRKSYGHLDTRFLHKHIFTFPLFSCDLSEKCTSFYSTSIPNNRCGTPLSVRLSHSVKHTVKKNMFKSLLDAQGYSVDLFLSYSSERQRRMLWCSFICILSAFMREKKDTVVRSHHQFVRDIALLYFVNRREGNFSSCKSCVQTASFIFNGFVLFIF